MNKAVQVFKFGGASVKDADAIKNVANILKNYQDKSLVIIVSAMGKTTNALEKIVAAYFEKDIEKAMRLLEETKTAHYQVMANLFDQSHEVFPMVNDIFVEIEWVLEDEIEDSYDYIYDQIVSVGELASSRILSSYLNENDLSTAWLDTRDIILTDDTFREGRVNWEQTQKRAATQVPALLENNQFVLTQGFIASNNENQTTTLGREGSDFSAAIYSFCLDATSMSIWKDVPGILTADPRLFDNVTLINRLSYKEAIEMTYYGAKVIHPKTIKPLQNKNIPLHVKSFINPEGEGSMISEDIDIIEYPPVIVVEGDQCLLHISTKDFSFVAERHLSYLFKLFSDHRIKINMMQNMAISFSVCVNNIPDRIKGLVDILEEDFKVVKDDNLELITVRNYREEMLKELTQDKIVLFEERIRKTIQMVVKKVPTMKWKKD